jgi:hypothetical protein
MRIRKRNLMAQKNVAWRARRSQHHEPVPVAFHSDKEHGAPPERKTQLDAAFQILQRAADNRRDGD